MSCIACPPNVAPELVHRLKGLTGEVREYLNSQNRRSNVSVELEVRLGHIAENGNFLANAARRRGAHQEGNRRFADLGGHLRERESVDFFFPAENGATVRSSRSISREGAIVLEHTQKNKGAGLHLFGGPRAGLADGCTRRLQHRVNDGDGRVARDCGDDRASPRSSTGPLTSGRTGPLI